jgi:hypothetical protein
MRSVSTQDRLQREATTWPPDPRAIEVSARGDAASRIGLLASLGSSVGNAAAASLVGARSARVQRQPKGDKDAGADASAAYMLTNVRFTPDKRLQEIAAGGAPLSKSDKAPTVKAVQTALLDVGYSLLRYKDDGKFGGETTTAIEQFRADSKISDGEGFNASAMKALDKRAPAPGKLEQHYLDYARLFADDRLDVTLAIGYDEGQSHVEDVKSARDWFEQHKMTKSGGGPLRTWGAPDADEPDKGKKEGLISVPETWTGKHTVTYPDATGKRVTKEITVAITLVPPGTGGKANFAKGLNDSELTLYSGHARRGIGPDFDADKSAYENFVIGVNSALHKAGRLVAPDAVARSHYVIGKKNDLEQMKAADAWKTEKYRIWFFAACSTIAYMDELRGGLLPEKMDRHNLDLFGTVKAIPIAAGLTPVFANLEGILAAETMEQIVERMQRSSFEAFRQKIEASNLSRKEKAAELKEFTGDWFMREGAGDNPTAPATP